MKKAVEGKKSDERETTAEDYVHAHLSTFSNIMNTRLLLIKYTSAGTAYKKISFMFLSP